MNEDVFNPSESIKVIEHAIKQAKTEKTGASFYYILWGVILTVHFLLLYIATKYPDIKGGLLDTLIWIVFPIGGLLSYFRSRKDTKTEKVLSLHEKVYLFAFGGFILAYMIMFIASAFAEQLELVVILCPLLLGLTVFVVGGITRHKVSVIGGVLGMICSGISLNVLLDTQYLLASLTSFITCVVPGLLMKK